MKLLCVLRITFLFLNCYGNVNENETILELVQVIFRHGNRTPRTEELYPTDPYNASDFPQGYGALTREGEQKAYQLGKALHDRYKNFLGTKYAPELVHVRTTDYDRTKATALKVLAGLFPPPSSNISNENPPWFLTPYDYNEDSKEFVLKELMDFCPAYVREYKNVLNSEEMLQLLHEQISTLEFLTNHTGHLVNTFLSVIELHQLLKAEEDLDLTLPAWTKVVYPEFLRDIGCYEMYCRNVTPLQRRLNGGRAMKVIINHIMQKFKGNLIPQDRKIYLFSAHDLNIVSVLGTLNLLQPHIPDFCSAVVFELHRQHVTNRYFVKVLHLRNPNAEPEEQIISNCDVFCPLQQFLRITEPYIPGNLTQECDSDILLE